MAQDTGHDNKWMELYRAALLELDQTKLLERIEIAERAIRDFREELDRHSGDPGLLQRLDDALYGLGVLRRLHRNRDGR